ncbi:MAG TPA: DUF3168 domain-containing protein [Anaerolineaceae bacterium]|jgi:hypothetical protein|nr:DUF3168 domain-containing protein [Anaerolineaceae bacterium]
MSEPDILDALTQYLALDAGVTALIGERIYPDVLPTNVQLPAARMIEVDQDTPGRTLEGPTLLRRARIQFDIYGPERDALVGISNALINALAGKSFTLSGCRVRGVTVENVFGEMDASNELRRRVVDFGVPYAVEVV